MYFIVCSLPRCHPCGAITAETSTPNLPSGHPQANPSPDRPVNPTMTPASAGAVGAVRSGEPAPTLKTWDAHPGPFPSCEERSNEHNHLQSHSQPINGEHHNGREADHGHGTAPSRDEAANGRGASRDLRNPGLPGTLHCRDRGESAVEPANPPTQ